MIWISFALYAAGAAFFFYRLQIFSGPNQVFDRDWTENVLISIAWPPFAAVLIIDLIIN